MADEQSKVLELADVMAKAVEKVGGVEAKVAELEKSLGAQIAKAASDIGAVEKHLQDKYGRSGRQDWKADFNDWIKALHFRTKTGKVPEWLKHMEPVLDATKAPASYDNAQFPLPPEAQKAATAFYSTSGAGTAYHFVPTTVWDDMVAIRQLHGNILPLLTKVTVPAGGSFRVPMDATLPTAYIIGQGTPLTEEDTPMAFTSVTLTPKMTGTWFKLQNELFESAQGNIASVFAVRAMSAIIRKQEESVLQGEDSGDDPHDGVLVIASTNDQTNLAATPTLASMTTFHAESVADAESLYNTADSIIVMHPAKISLLMGTTVGASELTGALSWGSPRDGIPPTCLGYPLIPHPKMLISSTYWAAMFHPGNVIFAESGPIAIDLNPWVAWTTNQTYLRAMTHFDFTVGPVGEISKADHS